MTARNATPLPGTARTAARGLPPAGGFSTIEMMVTILILAALAAVAMPSFADFTVNQRLRTATYDLIGDLTYARGEAVKRNNRVTIARAGASWAGGWTVTDNAGNTLRTHPALHASVVETTGPASVIFGLDGHQVGGSAVTITFDDTGSKTTIPVRKVILDPSGRPKSL